jgi:hypothetical protein
MIDLELSRPYLVACSEIRYSTSVDARSALVARAHTLVYVTLGDVVEESDGDLMGDGVNIAARTIKPLEFVRDGWRRLLENELRQSRSSI